MTNITNITSFSLTDQILNGIHHLANVKYQLIPGLICRRLMFTVFAYTVWPRQYNR